MSAERESDLFSRVMIQTESDDTKSYYNFIIKIKISETEQQINKAVVSCLKNC